MDLSSRVMETKTKINKWDLIKFKSFCTAKETIKRTKRQYTEWEIVFSNDVTLTRYLFPKYTNHSNSSVSKRKQTKKNKKQPNQKVAEDLNRHFSKNTYKWAKTHEKMLNITNC